MSTISNFPQGFGAGIALRNVPVFETFGGNVFWVNSARGSNGGKGTRERPFATLDYAIGRCSANNGDVILVAPNHAETVTGASGITADVAGITIVGLGTYNQRPRFLMDGGTTVSMVVSAADVTVRNLVFSSGHADIVVCIDVQAAGCWLDQLEFDENTTNEDWLTPIKSTSTTDNTADGLKITNCRWVQASASGLEFVELNADVKGAVVYGTYVVHEGTASPLVLCATGKDLKNCFVAWNFLSHKATSGNLFITNDTASPNNSGIIAHNRVRHADVTGAHAMGAVGGCGFFDNLSTSVDNLSGFVLPAIDVDL
jgi:hypothetical protein